MSFGENLQYLRSEAKLTQEQLAEQLEVSRQSVSKWESDTSFPENGTFSARYVSANTDAVYTALLEENWTVSVDINRSDKEWKKLNNDYVVFEAQNSKSPIYRMADNVTIGIDDGDGMLYYYYEEVGVRMKGNTSRREFYNDDGFFGALHMKLSFKQTFDDVEDGYTEDELKVWADDAAREARKDRMSGGKEKIDIKYTSTHDETYVREMYAMKLFRENGVIAPMSQCVRSPRSKKTRGRKIWACTEFMRRSTKRLSHANSASKRRATCGNAHTRKRVPRTLPITISIIA